MANIRVLWNNPYRTAALAASSEAAALPIAASQHTDRSYVYRSGSVGTAVTIEIDLGSALAVTSIALANVRLFAGGALKLYDRGAGGSPGSATLIATLPAQDDGTRVTFAFFASTAARHWQLEFTNPDTVTSYVELGYVHLGGYDEPAQNVSMPIEWRLVDPSVQTWSVDGQKTSTRRTKHLAGTFLITPAKDGDRAMLDAIYRAVGQDTPYFMVLNASLAWSAVFVRFASDITMPFLFSVGLYGLAWSWEEER